MDRHTGGRSPRDHVSWSWIDHHDVAEHDRGHGLVATSRRPNHGGATRVLPDVNLCHLDARSAQCPKQ